MAYGLKASSCDPLIDIKDHGTSWYTTTHWQVFIVTMSYHERIKLYFYALSCAMIFHVVIYLVTILLTSVLHRR